MSTQILRKKSDIINQREEFFYWFRCCIPLASTKLLIRGFQKRRFYLLEYPVHISPWTTRLPSLELSYSMHLHLVMKEFRSIPSPPVFWTVNHKNTFSLHPPNYPPWKFSHHPMSSSLLPRKLLVLSGILKLIYSGVLFLYMDFANSALLLDPKL